MARLVALLFAVSVSLTGATRAQEAKAMSVEDDVRSLEKVLVAPPTTDSEVAAARAQLMRLAIAQHEEFRRIARTIAASDEQPWNLRATALAGFGKIPGVPAEEVRGLSAPILRNAKAPLSVRHRAASLLGSARFADDTTRALLESVLMRKAENHILQRSCLRALGKTITRAALLTLLMKKEVHNHAYFGIRSDVCSALASLRVRDLRVLDVLCKRIVEVDPEDKSLVVPQEALLAFWTLTGRIHRVAERRRPRPFRDESAFRRSLFSFSWSRSSVTKADVRALEPLLWRPIVDKSGGRTRERNAAALTAAAAAYRKEFTAIKAEWVKEAKTEAR